MCCWFVKVSKFKNKEIESNKWTWASVYSCKEPNFVYDEKLRKKGHTNTQRHNIGFPNQPKFNTTDRMRCSSKVIVAYSTCLILLQILNLVWVSVYSHKKHIAVVRKFQFYCMSCRKTRTYNLVQFLRLMQNLLSAKYVYCCFERRYLSCTLILRLSVGCGTTTIRRNAWANTYSTR